MNIPMSWLNEYVDLKDVQIGDFIHRMTMIGQKVEGAELVADEIERVVIGKILKIEKHPDADKLSVTKVDVGGEITIVTGATNIKEGDFVPVALEGATLAGGKKITCGELRGIVSEGMMCSIEELGFTRNDFPEAPENGIYVFQRDDLKVGEDAAGVLDLKQTVVEYEVTSNRPDCFSVIGLAREAAAAYGKPLKMPETTPQELAGGDAEKMLDIEIKNPELCSRYAGRVMRDVKIEDSPQWLRRRLTSAGIRPINNIVDITNYVMIEMGQPMHAFDLSEVEGGIVVKTAQDGEKFTTLDGNERTLDSSMLVIADKKKSLAIAGVMGGEGSKITGGAADVLFESACFNGPNIRVTSKKLGLRTDASGKFEKGLDPNLAEIAVNRAAYLVESLGYGKSVKGIADCYPDGERLSKRRKIAFEPEKINKLIGFNLTDEEMINLVKPFGIEIEGKEATIPTNRPDIEMTADLAEEVARAYGYDNIEAEMINSTPTVGKKTYEQSTLDIIKQAMVSFGFYEAITYSFESPDVFDKLLVAENSPLRRTISVLNPLGEAYSQMRTTAVNSMLQSLSTNFAKRNPAASLFEVANTYIADCVPITELPTEKSVLIGGVYGGGNDFYSVKGYIESLLDTLGIVGYEFNPRNDIPWYHPGRCSEIKINGEKIGEIGEIHPNVKENYSLGERAWVFELDIKSLYGKSQIVRKYTELSKYPPVQRDIALLVSDDIMVQELKNCIMKNGGENLTSVELFDVYKAENIGKDMKSVAFALTFRSYAKTLEDREINPVMDKIVSALSESYGAKLRS